MSSCPQTLPDRPSRRGDLSPLLGAMVALFCLIQTAGFGGTWSQLAHAAPGPIQLMLLLPDGSVMAANPATSNAWYKLKPDTLGNYNNGTWTTLASMNDTRLYYSSCVLRDGRVLIAGAEYGTGAATAEIYDPQANTWT